MFQNKQFINWREVPNPNGGKPLKVPTNPVSGYDCDPHDPSQWMTFEQASANSQYRVGFVLTDNDPYFLFDLDDCRDAQTGEWHPIATQIIGMFPGVATEVSINGTGAHVVGRCNPLILGDRKNKFWLPDKTGIQCEFYHTKRFMALGHGFQGNIELDCTNQLAQIVPVREVVEGAVWTDESVPEYTGPDDDDELIKMMLNARGSKAQVFGDKASVKDLWEVNLDVLSRVFASPSGEPFDASSADQALMNHLAFYTGKNAARMDRLFRRSGLMRDKYEKRPDYRKSTVTGAVGLCKKVYDKPRRNETPAGTSDATNYTEIMDLATQIEYFKGCVYVADEHKIMTPGGNLLKPAQFKAMYGGFTFLMAADGTKPSTNAFEAFTENRMYRFPKVKRTRFKPSMPHGCLIEDDGVNVYSPVVIRSVEGDAQPIIDLVCKLLPDANDQATLWSWSAALVQNPGVKLYWSPVLQGTKGNGKSMMGEILTYCVGEKYSWTPKPKKLANQFNAFLSRRLFVNVEEMSMFDRYEMLDTIKDLVTAQKQEIEAKGIDAFMDPDYCANWYFASNHKDAVIKERDDRRFAVYFTAQQSREDMIRDGMGGDYFPDLWKWLRADGFAIMHNYLMNYQIPVEFNPADKCIWAPETSSTGEAIAASYGLAEQYILEAVAGDETGFRGGWVSTYAVSKLFRENGIKAGPRRLAGILEKLGYKNNGRASSPIFEEDRMRPTLYSIGEPTVPYEVAQQYTSPKMQVA